MTVAALVRKLMDSNAELSNEIFGSTTPSPQFVQSHGDVVLEVKDLFGRRVSTSPMLRELLFEVNGGANVVFGQRWLSVGEMADPFGPDAAFLYAYDPIESVKTARTPFFNGLEDDIYAYQEASGLDATGRIPEGDNLVLFGYNLIEIGTRPTYLYFSQKAQEPVVWSSAIDWTQIYHNLEALLEAFTE